MIVQVLVAERQSIHSLRQHLLHAVLDQIRIAAIQKALAKPRQQVHSEVGFPQQQCARIGSHRPTAELSHYFPLEVPSKTESSLDTLCHRKAVSSLVLKHLLALMFMPDEAAFCYTFVSYRG